MKKKTIAACVFSAAMAVLMAFPAFADTGWVRDGDIWNYYRADGSKVVSTWIKNGDSLFYVDENGAMVVNTWKTVDEATYWLDGSGAAASGWEEIDGKWYYFDETTHIMATEMYIGSMYVGEDGAWIVGK